MPLTCAKPRDLRFVDADGEVIRRRRERLGLSQADLAAAIGVTPLAISRWERGGQIRHANRRLLARVLEVPVHQLAVNQPPVPDAGGIVGETLEGMPAEMVGEGTN